MFMTQKLEKLLARVEADREKFGLGNSYSSAEELVASLNK